MKISAQDEYGLRILLRLAKTDDEGLNLLQLSKAEGLSVSYVAKLTRLLRMGGLIQSTRGQKGGYTLSKPSHQINIKEVLETLGGTFFNDTFCGNHSGTMLFCTNSVDCSVRSLWKMVQTSVDNLLGNVSLKDLVGAEVDSEFHLFNLLNATEAV